MAFRKLNTELDLVGIVDMLPPQDRSSWSITRELTQFLAGIGVEQKYKECSTNAEIFAVLRKLREISKSNTLMLHFVSHGNDQGLKIKGSAEPLIQWDELRNYLLELNRELGDNCSLT